MKCTCKQCGKEFELSVSEIDFYKKKNLNLPKRCKECRQANKKGQEKQIQYTNRSVTQNAMHNQYNVASKQRDNRFHKWMYGLTAGSILVIVGCIGLLLRSFVLWNNPAGNETVYSTESVQSEDSGTRQYVFWNAELLNDHFKKHGVEMGFSSAEEYQAAASAVVNNANALHKIQKEDGDDVYYLETTNEFVIVSTAGYIRTYFYPDSGIEYYNKQ